MLRLQQELMAAKQQMAVLQSRLQSREADASSEARRLFVQNEVLLALLGRPNAGIADHAATIVQRAERRHVARASLWRARQAKQAVQQAAARTMQCAARQLLATLRRGPSRAMLRALANDLTK